MKLNHFAVSYKGLVEAVLVSVIILVELVPEEVG